MERYPETNPAESSPEVNDREKQRLMLLQKHWAWVEPSVWTERMLTALETGVKGGRWYSLMDKMMSETNLRSSFAKVKANKGKPGIDRVTIAMFEARLAENIRGIQQALQNGRYHPQMIRRKYIEKPGSLERRPLGIPTIRDRTVQGALRRVLEPIFEHEFAEESYGFRPGRGSKDALRRVDSLLRNGNIWVVDADFQSYFDTIPHQRLMNLIKGKVADASILQLIQMFLEQGVMEGMRQWKPEEGTPQGAVLSPLLANIYLNPMDHEMKTHGYEMVRYADDFVVLCRTEDDARIALEIIRLWVDGAELHLHSEKTRIVNAGELGGFDFLGYHFERGYRWPRKKSLKKFKDTIRAKTKRCNGHSLDTIIQCVNLTLRGWFEYFKHSHRTTFPVLDGWIRMRVRSILRKRRGGRGRGRGTDHQRWPNTFFADHGLFSCTTAYRLACQSARR